ncbi:MAG: hypothetical protein ACFFCP_12155 [Promethearchaeota archaeon]
MNLDQWKRILRNKKTREQYVSWLLRFVKYHRCTIQTTLAWSVVEAEDRMEDFKHYLLDKGLAGETVKQSWNAIKRWYRDNRIYIHKKLEDVVLSKTYLDHIPSNEELKLILDSSPIEYKVAFSLIAFSGMRPVDVSNLRYKSIKASLGRDDGILTITLKQQKTGNWYSTFLGPQGLGYLRRLLDRRRAEGQRINDGSFVVTISGRKMNLKTMRQAFKRVAKRTVGTNPTGEPFKKFRLYGLRKYFRYSIKNMGEDEAEYLMGHVAGLRNLSARYAGIADMHPAAIRDLKQKYIDILPKLETEMSEISVRAKLEGVDTKVKVLEEWLERLGISKGQIRATYLENDIVGGGKSLRAESPEVIIEDLETERTRDPLDDLTEAELDELFVRALRKKVMRNE